MNVLFVLAHHEPNSFTASLARHGIATLERDGRQVELSDLYATPFNPVSDRSNFTTVLNPDRLDQQAEERHASGQDGFADDLRREMARLAKADLLVLQFPLWWLGMPAVLKGWIDRVFAIGVAYGGGRWFDNGRMKGKRAMLAVTVGGTEDAYSADGIYGPMDAILRPIHHGILQFCGFDVIDPFISYAPSRKSEQDRQAMFERFGRHLLAADRMTPMPMLRSDDYQNFVRRPGGTSR